MQPAKPPYACDENSFSMRSILAGESLKWLDGRLTTAGREVVALLNQYTKYTRLQYMIVWSRFPLHRWANTIFKLQSN